MKKLLIILGLFLCSGHGIEIVLAGTVYVKNVAGTLRYDTSAASCDDVTAGDSTASLQTIVNTHAGASGTCYICEGTITGSMIDSDFKLNLSVNNATIQGIGTVTIELDSDSNGDSSFVLNGYSGTVLKDLILDCGDSPITAYNSGYAIRALNSTNTTIDNVDVYYPDVYGVWCENCDGIIIKNGTMYGVTDTAGGGVPSTNALIYINAESDYGSIDTVTIDNMTLVGGWNAINIHADHLYDVDNVTVTNNDISGYRNFGIYIIGDSHTGTLQYNTIHDNSTDTCSGCWGRGIEFIGYFTDYTYEEWPSDYDISYNIIYNIYDGDADNLTDGVGIGLDEDTHSTTVHHNWLEDCEGTGINTNHGVDNLFYSNVVVDCGHYTAVHGRRGGISINGTSTGCEVWNNTVYGGDHNGIKSHSSAVAPVFKNNAVQGMPTGISCYSFGGGSCGDEVSDYNIVDADTTQFASVTPGTYDQQDVDPLFVNGSASNFNLTSSSPAANGGTDNGISGWTDYLGRPNTGSGFPVGAYELMQTTAIYNILGPLLIYDANGPAAK